MWMVPHLPNPNGRAMRECVRQQQCCRGSTVPQQGTGCTEPEALPGHGVCGKGKAASSPTYASLCLLGASSPCLPVFFTQIMAIIKNMTFPVYVSINSTHLSICEKTLFLISVFLPFVPFPSLSGFLLDIPGYHQTSIYTAELRWKLMFQVQTRKFGAMGRKKKEQALRALLSVCVVQCQHLQNPLYFLWWEVTRTEMEF